MLEQPLGTFADPLRRWQVVRSMLILNIIAITAMYLSGQWDAAEHTKGAVDRFWYPPHFGIYFALLVAALLPLIGLVLIGQGSGLPFDKLRRNAALTMVIAANGFSVLGAPFDAWWHETFGIDLTVWSPPHLHLLLGTVLAICCCAVYFLDDAPRDQPLTVFRSPTRRDAIAIYTLIVGLLMSSFLFVEYEGTRSNIAVLSRPAWTFPVVWSLYVLLSLALISGATRRLGMATLVAALWMLTRLAVLWFDRAVLDFVGFQFFPLVIPALAWDLALWLLIRRGTRAPLAISIAGLITAAVLAISTPWYWGMIDVPASLSVTPWRTYWPLALVVGTIGALLGWALGSGMRRLRPAPTADRVADVEPLRVA